MRAEESIDEEEEVTSQERQLRVMAKRLGHKLDDDDASSEEEEGANAPLTVTDAHGGEWGVAPPTTPSSPAGRHFM